MAQPLRSRLRPARHSGLTSPDPVRTSNAARPPVLSPQTKAPDKPQNRQRQEKHALTTPADENDYTKSVGGSRLRAHSPATWLHGLGNLPGGPL